MPVENSGFSLNMPYPEVESGPDNRRNVLMIMEDYAGMVSELSAVTQYIYGEFVLSGKERDISSALDGISLIEMKHLELIADAIIKLGGDPVYASRGKFWNAKYVSYVKRPREVLTENIKGEQAAIRQYKRHIEMTRNESVKRLLERIILDEELHIRILSGLLEKYK